MVYLTAPAVTMLSEFATYRLLFHLHEIYFLAVCQTPNNIACACVHIFSKILNCPIHIAFLECLKYFLQTCPNIYCALSNLKKAHCGISNQMPAPYSLTALIRNMVNTATKPRRGTAKKGEIILKQRRIISRRNRT
jgi:hypothetical protein